jgi:hypothetical protein
VKGAPALVISLVLVATGCGTSQPGGHPEVPSEAARPTWGGCGTHSLQNLDYVAGARGVSTLAKALMPYREPGDHLVLRPARAHRNPAWLLVDERNVIETAVEVWHTHGGWLVSMVDRCDD